MLLHLRSRTNPLSIISLSRSYTTHHHRPRPAFAFDIDGVLIRGGIVLDQGKRALKLLKERNIPHVFLTNGGGVTEAKKALELSKKFDHPIAPQQCILSHTPMQKLVTKYSNSLIVIIGSSSCKTVAESYGFKKVVTTEELHARFPQLWPLIKPNPNITAPNYDFETEPIRAVLTFYDSPDWGRDIQIATDVLRSQNGILGTLGGCGIKNGKQLGFHQSVELHFSNPDFVWAAEWPVNRFAQGAFRMALFHLFEALTGHTLKYTQYGKPETVTYDYAREVIEDVAKTVFKEESHGRKHHGSSAEMRKVFMIGDNPHSDITGAVRSKWTGILVRTGVFQGDTDALKMYPPNHIVDNVEDAVKIALKEEGLL